ncbi:hypothetical protein Avbf_06605 [Armadillidium vulgare]|nr:hypothetical protein Avbf_06605 [Armadillidium vulgare]
MQISNDDSFCRVLLSMHASCSEVLDVVSYLRPRKVFPNVIPCNSTKEEVLHLLHEALNRSGDHYSIEYGGSQRTSLGSFKRQLNSCDSTCSANTSTSILDVGLLDVYLSSPNKRRRHSDSNMTLILPTPRGNIKGSLSLEGEPRHEDKTEESQPSTSILSFERKSTEKVSFSDSMQGTEELEWRDPYSPSPTKSHPFFQSSTETCMLESTHQTSGAKRNLLVNEGETLSESESSNVLRKHSSNGTKEIPIERKVSGDFDLDKTKNTLKTQESQDSLEINSVFSDEGDRDSIFDTFDSNRPTPSPRFSEESPIKQSRKSWYKHKYFSTPVHDEVEKVLKFDGKSCIGPRSSSLPLPESCRDDAMSQEFSTSVDGERNLPLITVSSPSDQASESQVSDETNVTIVLSSGDPSDSDLLVEDLPQDNLTNISDNNNRSTNNTLSLRPSVICSPAKPEETIKWSVSEDQSQNRDTNTTKCSERSYDGEWLDCSKRSKQGKTFCVTSTRKKVEMGGNTSKIYKVNISDSSAFRVRNDDSDLSSPDFVDLVSESDCSPDFVEGKEMSIPSSSRSTCLKTVRRTHDHVEVFSLDHHPL